MSARLILAIGELEVGGTQRQMLELARGLNPRIFTPEVLCLSHSLKFAPTLVQAGIPVTVVKKTFKYDVSVISRLKSFLRNAEVLITFGFTADAWCRIAARIAKVPVVLSSVRTSSEESVLIDWVNRALVPITDHYIANSQAVASYLRGIGVRAEKYSVVVNGLDVERIMAAQQDGQGLRCSLGIGGRSFVVGIVGRLSPEKNTVAYLRIAQAFARICANAVFVVVGDGPNAERLRDLASNLGIASKVHWLGERTDVPALLSCFDVAMLTSVREGLSNTLLEYMGAALPIVASNVGGNPEVVLHQKTGFLYPVNDLAQAVRYLTNLHEDAQLRREVGTEARLRAIKEFSMDRMITQTQELLTRLLQSRSKQLPLSTHPSIDPEAIASLASGERRPN